MLSEFPGTQEGNEVCALPMRVFQFQNLFKFCQKKLSVLSSFGPPEFNLRARVFSLACQPYRQFLAEIQTDSAKHYKKSRRDFCDIF